MFLFFGGPTGLPKWISARSTLRPAKETGLPGKDIEKGIFVMASFCTLNILYVGSILGPNFMLSVSLAESLGCLQIGVKKPVGLGLQQGSLF